MGEFARTGEVTLTHWRAALIEIGRTDLADIAFHNRAQHPAMDWCRFSLNKSLDEQANRGLMPNIIDAYHARRAQLLWLETFIPSRYEIEMANHDLWEGVVDWTRSAQSLWLRHRQGDCQCAPRDYGRVPDLTKIRTRT